NRYEDFFLHEALSSIFLHAFSLLETRGPFCTAMPCQTTSYVLSIQIPTSEGGETDQMNIDPNIACWKILARSVGERSVRISPNFCPRSMMVATFSRPICSAF